MKKKLLALTLALMVAFAFTACSGSEEEQSSETANPITECSYDDMVSKTGIDIKAPDDAGDAVYSYIETDTGLIAQVTFKADDVDYCYRCKSTDVTDFGGGSGDDPQGSFQTAMEQADELTGMNYQWNVSATSLVKDRDAVFGIKNAEKEGFVAWLDVAPGFMYSLSAKPATDGEALVKMAEKIFVPMQGEV